jgi:hypothetical protein
MGDNWGLEAVPRHGRPGHVRLVVGQWRLAHTKQQFLNTEDREMLPAVLQQAGKLAGSRYVHNTVYRRSVRRN